MKLKKLLLDLKDTFPNHRIEISGKNNLPISVASIDCHLKTSPRELNKEVFYWGLTDQKNEIVVVINKKVKVYGK